MDNATALLQAIEAGCPFGAAIDAVVAGVLAEASGDPAGFDPARVQLALEVRAGGPLRTARAVRLALAVLDATPATAAARDTTG